MCHRIRFLQEEADSETLKDPLAATIAAEVSADDALQAEGQGSSGSPIQPQETVDTGSQHVLKVNGSADILLFGCFLLSAFWCLLSGFLAFPLLPFDWRLAL